MRIAIMFAIILWTFVQTMPSQAGDKILPEPLKVLSEAPGYDQGVLGERIAPKKEVLAYRQALSLGPSIRDKIPAAMKTSTAAGKLYLSILLRNLDEAAGKEALKNLAGDQTRIEVTLGCMAMHDQVSAIAQDLLEKWTKSMYYPEQPAEKK